MVSSERFGMTLSFYTLTAALSAIMFDQSTAGKMQAHTTDGCGLTRDFNGSTIWGHINSSGGRRSYRIHLPSNYDVDEQSPLILSYHGAGETAAVHENQTQLSSATNYSSTIVVYPQGIHNDWEGPTYATPNVSDKVFTTDLLNHLQDSYCIDPSQIYASGKSNGGGFVGLLACSPDHGGAFAAFAAVSGALYGQLAGDECTRATDAPTPVLEIHGGADQRANYNGEDGRGGPLPSIPDWLSNWAVRDGCPDPPQNSTEEYQDDQVQHVTYSCGNATNIVDHWKVDPMGHKWPRGAATGDLVDATQLVLNFFKLH